MAENRQKEEKKEIISVRDTLIISFGALSTGFILGVVYQFRKANRKFDLRRYDMKLAVKALVAGTGLCLGTCGLLSAAFIYCTGVTSIKELRYYFETVLKGKQVEGPSEEEINYEKETKGMTLTEEWHHLYNKYLAPEFDDHPSDNSGEGEVQIDYSLLKENVSEEELLEWERNQQKK